jgi:hypothetical protein
MEIKFYIDPETQQPHIYEHGVTEQEARQVIMRAVDDFQGKKGARIALGQTAAGRYLQVVYVRDKEPDSLLVINRLRPQGQSLDGFPAATEKKW